MANLHYTPGILAHIFTATQDNGGITWDPSQNTEPDSGFVVSLLHKHQERRVPLSDARACWDAIRARLASAVIGGCMLGTWADGEDMVLDLVKVYPTLESALEAGRNLSQDAIFHLDSKEVIFCNEVR